MQGTTLHLENIMTQELLATELSNQFVQFQMQSVSRRSLMAEIARYIFATDTTQTSNNKLPWKNKTTRPKLCQIRDNLIANYMAALFPKSNWLDWLGQTEEDEVKRDAIEAYMLNAIQRPEFKNTISKCLHDYVDDGNAFATTKWEDETIVGADGSTKEGYVGPAPVRIAPSDIHFNPAATSFSSTGKFFRSLMTVGDFANIVFQESTEANKEDAQKTLNYIQDMRNHAQTGAYSFDVKNAVYQVSGFNNFLDYLKSGYVEVLTFVGDYYDVEKRVFNKNKRVTIVDRHKLVFVRDNRQSFSGDGIYHVGWRLRQDNLWSMGPLENLVGMQYRIDHLENLKADLYDLVAYPPLKIKGDVEDFRWGPFERIRVGDDGDVELMSPDVNALQANLEIANLEAAMEEMSGSPKEAMGFRTPGEKTMYEVQRLEHAASRIFTAKIKQFEEQFLEPILNDMLKLAQENLNTATIRQVDPNLGTVSFTDVTKTDLQGAGRIRPMAARHFAEKAELVQNLNAFFSSTTGMDPAVTVHFSGIKLAELFEDVLSIEQYNLVTPYVRISEDQEAKRLQNAGNEETMAQIGMPAGVSGEDADVSAAAPEATV